MLVPKPFVSLDIHCFKTSVLTYNALKSLGAIHLGDSPSSPPLHSTQEPKHTGSMLHSLGVQQC